MRALSVLLILNCYVVTISKCNSIFILTLIANRREFISRHISRKLHKFFKNIFFRTLQQFQFHQNLTLQASCSPSQEALRDQKNDNYLGDMNNSMSTDNSF